MEEKKEPITQTKLAKMLGVSQVTVHRAITGHSSVSPETRSYILDAAERLGYRANFFASQLRSKQRKIILLGLAYLQDPTCVEITEAFEKTAEARGYRIMLSHLYDKVDPIKFQQEILGENGINAFTLIGGSSSRISDETLIKLADSGVNVMLVGRSLKHPRISQVICDNNAGCAMVAEHLAESGCKTSWVFSRTPDPSANASVFHRAEDYSKRAVEQGMKQPEIWNIPSHQSIESIIDGAAELASEVLDKHPLPDAIFACGLSLAFGVMNVLSSKEIKVGKDVRLIGYDDTWMTKCFYPPISTVRQATTEMGVHGANLMIDILEGRQKQGTQVIFQPELKVRET